MSTIDVGARPEPVTTDKGLRAGALGLLSSVVIAVSSTAPAYGKVATLGVIVAVAGMHSPGMLIVSFVPMLCIAIAFRELNKVDPDCGTTFSWMRRAFGPWTGWLGGWGLIVADVIVMASLSQIAGRYAFLLIGADDLAANTLWVTVAGVSYLPASSSSSSFAGIGGIFLIGVGSLLIGVLCLLVVRWRLPALFRGEKEMGSR
jgi:amino acid transporter